MKSLLIAAFFFATFSVHAASHAASDPTKTADNAALTAIFESDQAAREAENVDWQALEAADRTRRQQVLRMLAAGEIRTAQDYFHAGLIFQHGERDEDYRLANALATLAMALAPDDESHRGLVAVSWDRLLMSRMRPQWYATQYVSDDKGIFLFPVEEDAVSDAQRAAMTGFTLAQARARLPEMAKDGDTFVRKDPPTIEQLRREKTPAPETP